MVITNSRVGQGNTNPVLFLIYSCTKGIMCQFCGKPCGEREFCDEVCFEAHDEAMEEYQRWVAALPNEDGLTEKDS